MASQYDSIWRSKPTSDWTANGPAETGHNFIDQINEQKGNVENAQNLYNEQKGIADQSRQTFQDRFNNQTSYGDYYNQAKEEEGVNQSREQYQKSLAAVNGVQSAMTALPSSVNANSGRILSQSQRQAALANQMNEYNSTLQYWQNQNAGDLSQYQTALSAAQNLAGQQSAEQQQNIATALSDYHTTMNELNNMYSQIINERNVLRQIYGDMYDDEYNHMAQEIEMWAQQVQAETQRYADEQANARNQASINAQQYLADKQEQAQKNYNEAIAKQGFFGNLNDAYATYMSEIDDYTNRANSLGNYIWGYDNMLSGHAFTGNTAREQAQKLKNQGFEGWLNEQNPYLLSYARDAGYGNMLSAYGIGG